MGKLALHGLKVGDLVTYSNDDLSTGGVIFRITEDHDAVIPAKRDRMSGYGRFGWDAQGKKIPPMQLAGYARLKPAFEFFPTKLGKNPRGAGGTVLLYHSELKWVNKVELVILAAKYAELGTLCYDVARDGGMPLPTEQEGK